MKRPVVIEVWKYGKWCYAKTCMSVAEANDYIAKRKFGIKFRFNYTTKTMVWYR